MNWVTARPYSGFATGRGGIRAPTKAGVGGASLHTLLVDPHVRGASRDLLRRFAGQDSAFVRYIFNANDRSAPTSKHFDIQPWPGRLSRVKYAWSADWPAVASERAVRWLRGLSGVRG